MSDKTDIEKLGQMIGNIDVRDIGSVMAIVKPLTESLKSEVERLLEGEDEKTRMFYESGLLVGRMEEQIRQIEDEIDD